MSLYAIGDVHGCRATLDALLDALAPTPEDHLVFVGDYIDRGPDSAGVIERMIQLRRQSLAGTGPRCTFLRGNHDQMLLDWTEGDADAYDLWRTNGGVATLVSYPDHSVPEEHLAFLAKQGQLTALSEAGQVCPQVHEHSRNAESDNQAVRTKSGAARFGFHLRPARPREVQRCGRAGSSPLPSPSLGALDG